MGAGRPLVAALTAAALVFTSCGGDDEPAASTLPTAPDTIKFSSPDFKDGAAIPAKLTCDGEGTPPTLVWREVPAGQAVEMVLVVEDPDAKDGAFYHWTAYGLTAATGAGLAPQGQFPAGTKNGKNSAGEEGWTAPCPPKGEKHRYIFSLYALKEASALEPGASPADVLAKVKGAVARGTFTGTYERK